MALNVASKCFKQFCINPYVQRVFYFATNVQVVDKQAQFLRNKHFASQFRIFAKSYSDEVPFGVDAASPGPKPKRKKTVEDPKITLYDEKNTHLTSTMDEAKRIAKSRNLKIVKVQDATEHHKAVFKLVSFSALVDGDNRKKTQTKKQKKILAISSKISEHDLDIKIKNIKKALEKKFSIQVNISSEAGESVIQTIIKRIDAGVKGIGKLDKKINSKKPHFYIHPEKKEETPTEDTPPETPETTTN